jgi:hypothetical protein
MSDSIFGTIKQRKSVTINSYSGVIHKRQEIDQKRQWQSKRKLMADAQQSSGDVKVGFRRQPVDETASGLHLERWDC